MAEKSEKSRKTRLHVTGMTCTTCAATLEKALAETEGIKQAKVNFASETASVEYDPEKLDLADVIFAGYVEQEELPLWYNAADLLAYPSLYEGFGLPPLEAMASGTPVLTSTTSSLPEVVGDAGILVDPQNVNEIARGMLKVLRDKGLQEEMRRRGIERAKRFTWLGTAEETVRVYEEVIGGEDV